MFRSPCDLAMYLETLTCNVLDLERNSKIWKVRETSITDFVIANFMAHKFFPWIKVDGSNEATTNADFEVIFRTGGRDLTLLIQAKRSCISKAKSVSIPELFHPETTGSQNLALINYAARMKMIPLYSFYFSNAAIRSLSSSLVKHAIRGIMLNRAGYVRSLGFRKPAFKKNILQANRILTGSFPFHSIFCVAQSTRSLEEIARLSLAIPDAPRTIDASKSPELIEFTETEETLEIDLENIITPSISLEQRRVRDSETRDYRDGPFVNFQTFRVLVDLDHLEDAKRP
jgi:hypothetical protein